MNLVPRKWSDWIVGRRQALIDQKETMLFMAQANGMVQAGKRLTKLQNQLERERYIVRGEEDKYELKRKQKLAQNKRERARAMRGTRRFVNSLNNRNTSHKGG
ncbi:hypothetical protein QI334_03110 [Staphylococcus saprophyticus]|uniref:hypothetical protein n=1 Tax=Staphylococcus saprophyticus TaxID=29385 RepID=UPI00076B8EC2|nr:hypothetical protein [Staphylococcus saprophyticus]AMG20702.1 hypothetical protein AL528_10980 [Staphylococcus saprophyticus]MDW3861842.1 hypothetical protein [Staphylococcus saprophyticus]MDW3914106.1 hypothetical protein [Staphylococcus saprophyticus]MDW3924149.1 hypothetical protein [Staphylococcus saprophyticus]MDW3961879.1 hypothetical protein [Staphylococcus saprophyticus]